MKESKEKRPKHFIDPVKMARFKLIMRILTILAFIIGFIIGFVLL